MKRLFDLLTGHLLRSTPSPWIGLGTLLACALPLCMAGAARGESLVIASFNEPGSEKNWVSVNDDVMGGISRGGVTRTDRGTLLFKGNLSVENNGGFASVRTKAAKLGLEDASGLLIRARGDGRTYWVGMQTPRQFGASSYRAFMPTREGTFVETYIPFSDFKLQAFGRQLAGGPVDPAGVVSVGFTIADNKAGPFELEIEWIKASSGDAGSQPGSSGHTIVDVAAEAGTFKTLLAAAQAAGLAETLAGEGPLTVFAPTDEAFAKLPAGTVEALLKPDRRDDLAAILKYHVIAGSVSLARALEAGQGTTLEGGTVPIVFDDGRVRIGRATLVRADIKASNGLIHVIDQVLLPPETAKEPLNPVALVELAIERGVPLFNNGNPAACAAIYEVTLEALRGNPGVSAAARKDMALALVKMKGAPTASEKAWILRYALDRFISRHAGD